MRSLWLVIGVVVVGGCAEDKETNYPDGCADEIDNDNDNIADCDDPDCAFLSACDEKKETDDFGVAGCSDGLDNDEDLLVDCDDLDCAILPVCGGDGGNGGNGGNTGDDLDCDDPIADNLKGVTIDLFQSYELTGIGTALCTGPNAFISQCKCEAKWKGWGVYLEAGCTSVTLEGKFERVSTTCEPLGPGQPSFSDAVYVPPNGDTYHTFNWLAGRGNTIDGLASWVSAFTNNGPEDRKPNFDNPDQARQFFVQPDFPPALDPSLQIRYEESATITPGPGVSVIAITKLDLNFTETSTLPPYPDGQPAPTP